MIVSGVSRDSAITLSYFTGVVQRRKYALALPTIAGLIIGLANFAGTPNSFVSEAVVALDARRVALPTESVVSPLPQDSPVLRTEIDIISSRSMAAKVVSRLEDNGVAIEAEPQPRFSLAALGQYLRSFMQASAEPRYAEKSEQEVERWKVDRLLSRLRVSNDGRSFTIFLTFDDADPVFAAKVANAYALAYLDHQIEIQRTATRRVSGWLGETLVNLRADLEKAEQEAENFRQEAGLIETDGAILQAQRVSALNSEISAIRANLAGLQARLDTIKSLADQEQLPSLAEILDSSIVQTLRIEQARIERRLRELQDSKAIKSPEIFALRSELESIRHQIEAEIARIVASLTNEIAIARQKERTLGETLRVAQHELSDANHAEVKLAQLEREAAANRTIYESYLVRYKQTIEQDSIAAPEAQIISLAEPATTPAKPRLAAWILFGLGLGGTVGAATAVLREATDRRSRLLQHIENASGIPVIGALPWAGRVERDRLEALSRDTTTTFGRALFTLRRALRATTSRQSPSVIAVTSQFQDDGKTTLALGIAGSAAGSGMRAVVVDGDLRHPTVAPALGLGVDASIDQLLGDEIRPGDVVREVPGAGYAIVPARASSAAPEQLFASPQFRALIGDLRRRFDLVLIVAPEVGIASDAIEIAEASDRLLFVADFATRRVDQLVAAIRTLVACGQSPDGIVLNRVDRRRYPGISTQLMAAMTQPATITAIDGSIRNRA